MKKLTLTIGLGSLAMASVLSACDGNRPMWAADRPADTTANNRHQKLLCESPFKINLQKLQEQRLAKLENSSDAKIVVTNSSDDEGSLIFDAFTAKDKEVAEENAVKVDFNCQTLTAQVSFPGDDQPIVDALIESVAIDKLVLKRAIKGRPVPVDLSVNDEMVVTDHEQTIVISISGVEKGVNSGDLSKEDGINQIRVDIDDKQTEYKIPATADGANKKLVDEEVADAKALDDTKVVKTGEKLVKTIVISESVAVLSNLNQHEVFVGDVASILEGDTSASESLKRLSGQVTAMQIKTDKLSETEMGKVVADPSNLKVQIASSEIIVNKSKTVKVGLSDLQEINALLVSSSTQPQ